MAPSERIAISAMHHSGRFSIAITTRSPGAMPSAARPRARRTTASRVSRQLIDFQLPPRLAERNGRSPNSAARAKNIAARLRAESTSSGACRSAIRFLPRSFLLGREPSRCVAAMRGLEIAAAHPISGARNFSERTMAQAALRKNRAAPGKAKLGVLPAWRLGDLYTARDAPELSRDLDWARGEAKAFR